jgi:hypothetical protein
MDYKDEYIKCKTKYLELKNIDINNMIGGSKKDLFIFIGGYGMAPELWNYNLLTMEKTNFLNKIEEIGDVYKYYPKFYNIQYYLKKNEKIKNFYDNDIEFNIDDINFKKESQYIYDDVNKLSKYDRYIIICTSIGIHYAIELSKLLTNCIVISIEGSHIGKNARIKFEKTLQDYESKYKNYTNEDLKKLIKDNNYDEIDNLIGAKMVSNIDFDFKKFDCPNLHFQNLIIEDSNSINLETETKNNEKNMLKINTSNYISENDEKYNIIWLYNKGHVAFGTDTENILHHIKKFLQ